MILQTRLKPENFYDVYIWDISAKLKKIDLFLRASDGSISAADAADVLGISSSEAERLITEENIDNLNKHNFMKIMRRGSSGICRYIRREVECGSPLVYTREDIAYIYDLNIDDVARACEITGIKEATAFTLPALFFHIPAE